MNDWFKGRGVSSWRKDVEKLLRNLGVNTTDELLNKVYALSLSDQYWIKEENSTIAWNDTNFFENDFEYKAFFNASLNDTTSRHPDLSSIPLESLLEHRSFHQLYPQIKIIRDLRDQF